MTPIEAIRNTTKDERIAIDLEKQTPRSSTLRDYPSEYSKAWERVLTRLLSKDGSAAVEVSGEFYEARLIRQGIQSRYRKELQEGGLGFRLGSRLLENEKKNKHVILFFRREK